jgi:hypothetical protein
MNRPFIHRSFCSSNTAADRPTLARSKRSTSSSVLIKVVSSSVPHPSSAR